MSADGMIRAHRTADAIHFTADGVEFLKLRRGGECVIRSLAPDGTRHEHSQHHPDLLKLLASAPGPGFAIGVESLPPEIAEHFQIPSVIVFVLDVREGTRLLMARESLREAQLNLLRAHLRPFAGVLTERGFLVRKPTDR